MFLKTDYGAILGGLDAPMAKGIVLTDCTKKTKEFSTVKRFSFSSSANAVAFTFDDGAVSVFNARKIEKVVNAKLAPTKGAFLIHLERGECHARISEKIISEKRLERSD